MGSANLRRRDPRAHRPNEREWDHSCDEFTSLISSSRRIAWFTPGGYGPRVQHKVAVWPTALDGAYAAALVVLSQVEVWAFGTAGGNWPGAVSLLIVAAGAAWRSRFPTLSAAVVVLGGFVEAWVTDKPGTVTWAVAVVVAWFTLGALSDRRRAVGALIAGVLLAVLITQPLTLNDLLAIALTSFAVPWLAGTLRWRFLHGRRAEERAEVLVRESVEAERLRLARELHDVVSHNVGMIAVQASAGDVLLDRDPEQARQSLRAIEAGARDALVELRRMLGLLRGDDKQALLAEPGLAGLDPLLSRVRAAGVAIELSTDGERRALSRPANLAAYRVVQEALTNVLKHAGPCTVTVRLRYEPCALYIDINDNGRGPESGAAALGVGVGGYGLTGVAERLAALGGQFDSGPGDPRGFRLSARLPISAT